MLMANAFGLQKKEERAEQAMGAHASNGSSNLFIA
jgi:hypothetical protein